MEELALDMDKTELQQIVRKGSIELTSRSRKSITNDGGTDGKGRPAFRKTFARSIMDNVIVISTIVAVAMGILIGMTLRQLSAHETYTRETISMIAFPGEMFLKILKMLVLPLIISTVISALASLDSGVSGRVGFRAFGLFLITTLFASIIGIILATIIHPGNISMKQQVSQNIPQELRGSGSIKDTVTDLVRSLIPDNIVSACFQHPVTTYHTEEVRVPDGRGGFTMRNETVRQIEAREGANVLGLMFFCCVFGVICSKSGERAKILVKFFKSLDQTIMQMVMLAMYFSPIGIMSLIIEKLLVIEDIGSTISRLGIYAMTVIVGLVLHGFISIPAMYAIITRKNPLTFLQKCTECIVFAFGTASSAATLPVTLRCLEEKIMCDSRITRFLLPLGTSMNKNGSSLFKCIAVIFIGQMNGRIFSMTDLVTISLISTAASFAGPAMPSAGLVTTIIVLTAVNLPAEDVPMLIAIDWFLDRLRTPTNVICNCFVAGIVEHLSRKELNKKQNSSESE